MEQLFSKCSERVASLREKVLGAPEICTERAYLMTESYKQTEDEAMVIRRAKAMDYVMQNMTIRIEDGELIVGNSTGKHRGCPLIPELQWKLYLDEIDEFSTRKWDRCGPLSDEEKARLRKCLPYWEGKTPQEMQMPVANPLALRNVITGTFQTIPGVFMHLAHTSVDYEMALSSGFADLIGRIKTEISRTDPAESEKITYLNGAVIALDAVIKFAARYADLALTLAERETDSVRRAELYSISEVCRHVPAYPPRSFHEALQAMWFVNLGLRIEGPALGITFGRPDQFLYPYYKHDIESGTLSDDAALELIALTLVKMNDMAMLLGSALVEGLGGFPTMAGITLGGVTKDGACAVNELSYLFLEAETQVGLTVDEVIVRVGEETPDEFIQRACEANMVLQGKLKWVSDYTTIKQFLAQGRPIEYARDYILAGCFTPAIPSVCFDNTAGALNIMLLFELALNNGVSRMTGEQIGPETGDPKDFKSISDVYDALRKQAAAVIEPGLKHYKQFREFYAAAVPSPLHSILMQGCIEKGLDYANGLHAPYLRDGYGINGLVDMADSLAALKLAVFDKKVYTMSELIDALDKNFEGYEDMQQFLKNAPKFGNDIEYVDSLANDVIDIFDEEFKKYRGFRDADNALASAAGTAFIMYGQVVGATPDGRNAGEALAEGGVSPHQGRNKTGITSTFNSVSSLNHVKLCAGSVFNLRINPSALKDKEKVRKFASMLRTYCKRGGWHAQFNIVDGKILRAAQKEPEQYRDLVVRVATYSAKFTELSTALQDDIIDRSEFGEL